MENIYIIFVVILFALAISDLIVGVSNDAVNFLNSAIGSKAAPIKWIMIIASLGILVGATFSSGMMEVARKSIFHPEQFYFAEVMIIFLAVMTTDVILLDLFNTFGLPTSTTVSIVFELLGAAVGMSLIKMKAAGGMQSLDTYINSEKAMLIIFGILLSIVFAFLTGMVIQFITRLVFTFNYKKTYKYFGGIFGGLCITAITYFILIKGAKGSSFITDANLKWINNHTLLILLFSFTGWSILLQLLSKFFKLNIFKCIVLVGTFALAMAFAGNDLVNFIGVPLAGLKSFQIFDASGLGPMELSMNVLSNKVKTNTYLLLIAGLIMVATLWASRKARTVTETEINLSRQDSGHERFGSSFIARVVVRRAINVGSVIQNVMPRLLMTKIQNRFHKEHHGKETEEAASFDLVRASVNLTVASILIAIATSLKLPLSTTYVTFMVAMGSSFSDRAWDRDSAVYRITGVMTVIGGWFLTAFLAFTTAFLMAFLINFGGIWAILIIVSFIIFLIIKTKAFHLKRELDKDNIKKYDNHHSLDCSDIIFQKYSAQVLKVLSLMSKIFMNTTKGLIEENLAQLKEVHENIEDLRKQTRMMKNGVFHTIQKLEEEHMETGYFYIQMVDSLREMTHCLKYIGEPSYDHINNNHIGLLSRQKKDLEVISKKIIDIMNLTLEIIKNNDYKKFENVLEAQREMLTEIESTKKNQIKIIKEGKASMKNSILYLGILSETKNLLHYITKLIKAQRKFNASCKTKNN